MCEHCREKIEDALIDVSRDPHLIAMILAGHPRARWFRERLRQTILDLRAGDSRAEPLLVRLGELRAECPGAGGHGIPLLRQAAAAATQWRLEPPGSRAAPRVRTA